MAFEWLTKAFADAASPWSAEQRQRLQYERTILAKYFPRFTWANPAQPGSAHVAGTMRTNAGASYAVQLMVPADLPNSAPLVFVVHPRPLRDHNGRSLATGVSAKMHLLSPRGDCVSICHYRPSNWTPRVTFYLVLVKVRLWLEAYDGHRATGQPIDHFLKHQ